MKRILPVLFACAAMLTSLAVAQEKPNFAGTWKLVDPATPAEFVPTQMVVARDATTLTVTTSSQMGEFKTDYKLDGSQASSPLDFNGMTIDRITKLAWEGSTMVLIASSKMEGQSIEFKSAWSLTPDGTLVTETTVPDFQGGGAPIKVKASYKKN